MGLDHLRKRELFAVSLRKVKKAKMISEKRNLLRQRINKSLQNSEGPASEQECLQQLSHIDMLLKSQRRADLPSEVEKTLTKVYNTFKSTYKDDFKASRELMLQSGAILNIA